MDEVEHAAEDAHHHAAENKQVALLISILALLLAISEILGQRAQTETLQKNIEASNLWGHFQAKTIRMAVLETSAGEMKTLMVGITEPALKKAMHERLASMEGEIERLDHEAGAEDSRKALTEQAKEAEHVRDRMGKKHNRFEIASGAFQIGIVLASATVITGIAALLWAAGGLGALGLLFLIAGAFG